MCLLPELCLCWTQHEILFVAVLLPVSSCSGRLPFAHRSKYLDEGPGRGCRSVSCCMKRPWQSRENMTTLRFLVSCPQISPSHVLTAASKETLISRLMNFSLEPVTGRRCSYCAALCVSAWWSSLVGSFVSAVCSEVCRWEAAVLFRVRMWHSDCCLTPQDPRLQGPSYCLE